MSEQLDLFGGPRPLPTVDRSGPLDTWLYTQGDNEQHCDYSGAEREQSRAAQHQAWLSGWRPSTAPAPYRPEPEGTPARVYEEPDATKSTKDKIVWKSVKRPDLDYDPDVRSFDKIVVSFSGGKDSVACLLHVIELCVAAGIDPSERIECWHQCVDGDPRPLGQDGRPVPKLYLWDWPSTEDYLVKVCNQLRIPLLFQWRTGGIMGGVFLRKGDPPMTVAWEDPGQNEVLPLRESAAPPPGYTVVCNSGKRWSKDVAGTGPGEPRKNHRLKWPAIGAITQGRYCSSYVKIEPSNMALRAQARFDGMRVLIVTGERAEESANRATYKTREFVHKAGHGKKPRAAGRLKVERYVEGWRPVLHWCEIEVWGIMARHKITPHPAYSLGWGRLSCLTCIFASKAQFETIRSTSLHGAERFAQFQRAEAALCRIQGEEKRYPARWNKDDFKKALPTIKSRVEKVGNKKLWVPVPLGEFADVLDREDRRVDPEVVRSELESAGVPAEVVSYHVARAQAGMPVAYFPAITQPELVLAAMSNHLPVAGEPKPGGGVWNWTWSPVEPRWQDPAWLPAGAFGEDAGPT